MLEGATEEDDDSGVEFCPGKDGTGTGTGTNVGKEPVVLEPETEDPGIEEPTELAGDDADAESEVKLPTELT